MRWADVRRDEMRDVCFDSFRDNMRFSLQKWKLHSEPCGHAQTRHRNNFTRTHSYTENGRNTGEKRVIKSESEIHIESSPVRWN